ncbi:hypothetical protein [Leucobacter sp.]
MPIRTHDAETLLWCMRPALHLFHLRGHLPERLQKLPPAQRPFKPASHSRYGDILVVTETVNQERALHRLVARDSAPLPVHAPSEEQREPVLAAYSVRSAVRRIIATLEPRAVQAVVASFENQLYKVALALTQYRAFDLSGYRGVLVATQHSPIMRALMVAAEEQGVPVVYVPHAPVAANLAYLDLPVSYAGLRGVGEQHYYVDELGIPASLLDAVGNLASDVLSQAPPSVRRDGAGVLALSPHEPEVLSRIFSAVAAGSLGEMVVAPHPRSDLAQITGMMPAEWSLYEGERTLDLLASGPPFLFQFSSGVAWESAALGIPTATVHIDDAAVNYPFLADESVYPAIRTPEDATRFASLARAGGVDQERLRRHAEEWCSVDGDRAAARLSELLGRVAAPGRADRPARLHDGWTARGAALSRSWLLGTPAAPA